MDSIRKEIEAEIKRARLDKGRLYDLLLKIVDSGGAGGGAGAQGPAGPMGAQGPAGPQGPAGSTVSSVPKVVVATPNEDKPAAKKTIATTPAKKKVTSSAPSTSA